MTPHSEHARQWVHIGSGAFALLLRFMTWWQGAALAAFALVFNLLVLPRVGGRRLYRPTDEARGFPLGILVYPLAVLLLILVFPTRPDIAAAAWAVLALGDGAATLVGHWSQKFDRRRASLSRPLPWNREKTMAGTLGFILFGAAGGVALALWTRPAVVPPAPWQWVICAPIAAAVAAAFVETLPVRLDDNISVPITAAAVLWLADLMTGDAIAASSSAARAALPWAIGVNAIFAWLGYRARTVSVSGAVGGAMVGTVIYTAGGAAAWVLLFVTFVTASVASRLGLERKTLLGIAEERGGRRGAGNAFANCGVAAAAVVVAAATPYHDMAMVAFVAALTAGGSDTVASEIGKAWGRSTFLVTSLGRVKPGTAGAMSLEGTAAGIVAALALAATGVALGLTQSHVVVPIVIAATLGALAESALGATLEGPGILNNDMLNFINTAIGAVVAVALV